MLLRQTKLCLGTVPEFETQKDKNVSSFFYFMILLWFILSETVILLLSEIFMRLIRNYLFNSISMTIWYWILLIVNHLFCHIFIRCEFLSLDMYFIGILCLSNIFSNWVGIDWKLEVSRLNCWVKVYVFNYIAWGIFVVFHFIKVSYILFSQTTISYLFSGIK